MSPHKSVGLLNRPKFSLTENNIRLGLLKSNTDSHKRNNVSNLLASMNNLSVLTNDNSSDSDDPFEDISVSKNINFSRSRSYFGDDYQLYPLTPRLKHKLDCEKENQPMNSAPSSFIKEVQKGLSVRKNSPKHLVNSSNKNLIADESLVLKRTHIRDFSRTNQTSPLITSNAALEETFVSKSDVSFNPDASSSKLGLGATSTPTNSSCDVSKSVNRTLNCEISTVPTSSSSPVNPHLDQYSCTPINKSSTPQISSMKQYSLKKAAISAKKKFENIVRNAMIQKNGLKSGQKYSKTTPEGIMNFQQSNSKQCHSSINFPSTPLRSLTSDDNVSMNKTPLCTRDEKNSVILTGIKQLNTNKVVPNSYLRRRPKTINSQIVANHHEDVDDDLPATQPLSSILLRGIVAYVEIKSGKEYRCAGTKFELESLGAKVENNFTKKVTHCFFHGGKMSTYRRAIEWNIPLVSILWIEACKAELQVLPIQGFEPYGLEKYKEELPLYKLKTKIRRPVTESKLLTRPWKRANLKDKASQAAASICGPSQASNIESDKLVEALHSVAGDIKKASHQMEKILTSPVLQKANNQPNDCFKNPAQKKTPRNSKKRNKKLIFGSSSEDEQQKMTDSSNSVARVNNEPDNEIRVSYDSDDMLVYAKKEAASTRSSAPPRLLTSRKCKKLLSSCSKKPNPSEKDNNSSTKTKSKVADNVQTASSIRTQRRSKQQHLVNQEQSEMIRKPQINENTNNKQKTKKRKLLLQAQTIEGFQQNSRESTPDLLEECPYKVTPNKRQKTASSSKSKIAKPLAPLIPIDWESDDSLTRAARRESSSLFVKKQKNNLQRSVPTIVCTSLHRSDVEVVASMVSTLGGFVVEGTVSERTTHVITSSPRRTLNLLKGIARGCWVLNVKWIFESLESGKWLHEERFELLEFSPAVRQARVERQAFGPEFKLELFQGVGPIYVCRTSVPPAKDLTELVRLCGGVVVSSARAAKIIIGTSLPFSPFGQHPLMVKEKWILDSISQLCQLNPRNYISVVSEP